ncbi:hypothetical protein B0H14DRAFT_2597667 [Mycena olivaceomarginata]|nr:hypothetical protein B0H14DRAFT_2597667 [Mycena olivaceomarginata]
MLVSDSHFVLLLLSSLVLPVTPVIDPGSTQSPTPAPTAWNRLWDAASTVWKRRAHAGPAHSAHHSSYAEKGTMPRQGAHKRWQLASALRWNVSDVDLGMLEMCPIFLGRAGGRHKGANWVHMCSAAQLRELARQYK